MSRVSGVRVYLTKARLEVRRRGLKFLFFAHRLTAVIR